MAGTDERRQIATNRRARFEYEILERFEAGQSASFDRAWIAERPTWLALLPAGHTDGYPAAAAGRCKVLVNDRLFPVVSEVSSTHTIVELGGEPHVRVGDTATLIGPDHDEVGAHHVAKLTGRSYYQMITKFSAFLPKRLIG